MSLNNFTATGMVPHPHTYATTPNGQFILVNSMAHPHLNFPYTILTRPYLESAQALVASQPQRIIQQPHPSPYQLPYQQHQMALPQPAAQPKQAQVQASPPQSKDQTNAKVRNIKEKCITHYIDGQLIIETSKPLTEKKLKSTKKKKLHHQHQQQQQQQTQQSPQVPTQPAQSQSQQQTQPIQPVQQIHHQPGTHSMQPQPIQHPATPTLYQQQMQLHHHHHQSPQAHSMPQALQHSLPQPIPIPSPQVVHKMTPKNDHQQINHQHMQQFSQQIHHNHSHQTPPQKQQTPRPQQQHQQTKSTTVNRSHATANTSSSSNNNNNSVINSTNGTSNSSISRNSSAADVKKLRAEMASWSVAEVVEFIERHEDIRQHSSYFADDEVDGSALLLMIDSHLEVKTFTSRGIKLGPAMKIEAALSKYKIN